MTLADAIADALEHRRQMKASGMTEGQIAAGFEAVVREVWPRPQDGREEPWHYYCEACWDTGLELGTCDGEKAWCGRRKKHGAHEYGKACTCQKGAAFRKPERSQNDLVAAAARTAKPTRFGQR